MTIAIAVACGLAIGVSLGLLGGGGSILAVPALVYLLGQDVDAAVPTSLLVVGASSFGGIAEHARNGDIRWRTALGFAVPGTATSFAGAWLNSRLDQNVLLLIFAGLMLLVAVRMVRRSSSSEPSDGERRFEGRTRLLVAATGGALVGFVTGLLGVGGGFLIVPALVSVLQLPMAVAVGTSLVVIVINAAAGFVANLGGADLDLAMAGAFTAGGLVGAVLGARLAPRIEERRLRRFFSALIVAVALFIGAQVVFLGGPPS